MPIIFISIELIHHRRHHGFQNKEGRFYMLCMGTVDNNMKIHKNSWSRHQIWQDRQCTYNAKLWHIQIFASRFLPFIWQGNVLKIRNQLLDKLLLSSSSSTVTTIRGTDGCYKSSAGRDTESFFCSLSLRMSLSAVQYTCV